MKRLRILFTLINGWGHINACHGLAEELLARGHEVIFVLEEAYRGKLTPYGIQEWIITPDETPPNDADDGQKEVWHDFVTRNAARYRSPPEVQITDITLSTFRMVYAKQLQNEPHYRKAIVQLKPDLIIDESFLNSPVITASGLPWIWFLTPAPHMMLAEDGRFPPFGSGLPATDRAGFVAFRQQLTSGAFGEFHDAISAHTEANGDRPLPPHRLHHLSPWLNIFMWPRELRYAEMASLTDGTLIGADNFIRTVPDQAFALPDWFAARPGQLVLFSMGSFACANVALMQRLVAMLAKSPHKFIVSKGPSEYELPGGNLYGERFLPQTAVLPLVDLVITHGGNNTVTETFHHGKPMIVMPTFFDQHDNAQRIHELGLGLKLNPFEVTETELLAAIDRVLGDTELLDRMRRIGQRIRSCKDRKLVVDRIEALLCCDGEIGK